MNSCSRDAITPWNALWSPWVFLFIVEENLSSHFTIACRRRKRERERGSSSSCPSSNYTFFLMISSFYSCLKGECRSLRSGGSVSWDMNVQRWVYVGTRLDQVSEVSTAWKMDWRRNEIDWRKWKGKQVCVLLDSLCDQNALKRESLDSFPSEVSCALLAQPDALDDFFLLDIHCTLVLKHWVFICESWSLLLKSRESLLPTLTSLKSSSPFDLNTSPFEDVVFSGTEIHF